MLEQRILATLQRPRAPWRIYLVECVPRHKSYVGATARTVEERFRQHARDEGSPLYKDIQRFGEAAFLRRTLELAETLGAAETLERRYIRDLGTLENNGYNRSPGGEGLREEATLRGEVQLVAFKNAGLVAQGLIPPVRPFATVDQARAYQEHHADAGILLWLEEIRQKHPDASERELDSLLYDDAGRRVQRMVRRLMDIAWGGEPRHPFKDLAVAEEFFLRKASKLMPIEEAHEFWRHGCEVRTAFRNPMTHWADFLRSRDLHYEDYIRQREMKLAAPVEVARPKAHAPPPAWWPSVRRALAWLVQIDGQLTDEQADAAERLSDDIRGMSPEAWASIGRSKVATFAQMIGGWQSSDPGPSISGEGTP